MKHEPLRYAHEEGHTDIYFAEDGDKFITCGADGDIRIWSTDESIDPVHSCVGESALSIAQKGEKIYVGTGSNDIQILTLPDGDRDGVLDRFLAPINHIAVSNSKDLIALAGEDMEVKLIDLERSNKEVIVFNEPQGPCLAVAICPNSKYLAASSGDTKLRIWDIETKKLAMELTSFDKVNSFANAKSLCRMHFEPKNGSMLAYPEKNRVTLLDTRIFSKSSSLSCDKVNADFSIVQYSPSGKYLLAASVQGDFVIWNTESETVYSYSKHEKSVAICGLMWNPLNNGDVVYTDIEGQLGVMTDCIKAESIESDKLEVVDEQGFTENEVDFTEVQFEDDDQDNENAVSVEKLKREYLGSPEPELQSVGQSSRSSTPRPTTPKIPLQSTFMPSSTPEHLDPRYLCWNDVGIVKSYGINAEDEGASKSIEVEFHDSTFHNSLMMPNYQEYTMGSLSKSALVVANTSQIHVVPLSASSKEWMLKVENDEEVVLVAASEELICFATSNYIVRVAGVFGTQRGIFSLPGPLVSMAANRNTLNVAYHSGGVIGNDQCINIKSVSFEGFRMECKDLGSALGPESRLAWLGFSDLGTPGIMDSLGILRLYPYTCSTWIPYCDTTKHRKCPSDGFFVTAVFESYQAVGGIKCKGSMYPGFTPRPTMCELPLEPLFSESSTEKTQMEMNMFTWSTLQVPGTDKKEKETGLKLFALACRNNLDQRALEFMEILDNPQVLKLALKYATKLEKKRLAEKLMELLSKINDDFDESLGVGELNTPEATARTIPKRLTLSSNKHSQKFRLNKDKSSQEKAPPKECEATFDNENNQSLPNTVQTVEAQESFIEKSEDTPKNPFAKSSKKSKVTTPNPLSLIDTLAGVNYEKDTKKKNVESTEKRKQPDSEGEKQKGKQRKLDCFRFKPKS